MFVILEFSIIVMSSFDLLYYWLLVIPQAIILYESMIAY